MYKMRLLTLRFRIVLHIFFAAFHDMDKHTCERKRISILIPAPVLQSLPRHSKLNDYAFKVAVIVLVIDIYTSVPPLPSVISGV
jgi:hypothetical protein